MGTRIRNNPDHVFELFCEVGIPATCSKSSWIVWKYPYNFKEEETLKSVPEFAYPVEFEENAVHHFSFVLTNVDSKWTFGFCRHAPNSSSCLVLLSYLPWHEAFYRILNHIADLSNNDKLENSKDVQSYLEALYKAKIPDPGMELNVKYSNDKEFVVICPDNNKLPSIPENRNITEYFNAIDAFNMISIFASMLHERRILVVSKKLSRLSACVQAANSLIYPMHWQHIFIPVLPKHLLDYLSAPMPFLIGVPTATFSRMKHSDMGDVVILHADENVVISPYADSDALPSDVLQSLRHDLKRPHEMIGDCVARAFLRASVKLIGGYWNALKLKPGEKISFSPELFVQTRPAPMQPFLEKMLDLQIFQQFIESRLKMLNSGQGVSDVFEFELTAHEDKASTRLRNQYRDWVSNMKKEGGAFFKSVKIKVKDTSKKAYKDIRSRIHDIHHHHKIVDDDRGSGFRKRGSSVPSLFSNEQHHMSNQLHLGSNGPKFVVDKDIVGSANRSKLHLQLSDVQETQSNPVESPILSFDPIDMDLMNDLHKYFFSNCSLCSDNTSQRTSISDPQLTDLSIEDRNNICKADCPSRLSNYKFASKDDTPPPLLPRPPSSKQNSHPILPKRSYTSQSFDKPLIELDGKNISYSVSDADLLLSMKTDSKNSSFSDVINANQIGTTNPFQNSFLNSSPNHNDMIVRTIKSTNPFLQSVPNVPSQSRNLSPCSGPNVRDMISLWQSTNSVAPNVSLLNNSRIELNVPNSIPYRSQPLSRTVSTPSPFVTMCSPSLSSPSSPLVPKNPFLINQDKVTKKTDCTEKILTSQNTVNFSWENFQ